MTKEKPSRMFLSVANDATTSYVTDEGASTEVSLWGGLRVFSTNKTNFMGHKIRDPYFVFQGYLIRYLMML
jgi:hypothetical protein